jgi:hypothetical protein
LRVEEVTMGDRPSADCSRQVSISASRRGSRRTVALPLQHICAIALAFGLFACASAQAGQVKSGFPYSIMTPEPGAAPRQKAHTVKRTKQVKTSRGRVKLLAKHPGRAKTARGSSGSVLPTPLPRTTLIPPVSTRIPPARPVPQPPGDTIVPGLPPIPNLPSAQPGRESFQDRAARCAHQAGLYGVPNDKRGVYLSTCAM